MPKYAVLDMDITVMFQGMFQGMPSGLNIQLWNIFTMKYKIQENAMENNTDIACSEVQHER